jgi:UDP-N-acetylmuramate dehydrogenase
MMAAERLSERLIDRLPPVRGRYREGADLARITWFRVGGPAEVMFRPADAADLADFLKQKPADVPVTVIGVGSNLLVRDGGVSGVVIRLGRSFAAIEIDGDEVMAGAGALDSAVAQTVAGAGLGDLEFLAGIPGTIGGGLRMNGGAYGCEIKDVLIAADGTLYTLMPADMGFGYRHCSVPADHIFTSARLRGTPSDRATIKARIKEIQDTRSASQPVRTRTGGSTFKNPVSKNPVGKKAWELIDAAGCRGFSLGGARVSEQHCNFLINTGSASAADIEALGEEVRKRVAVATGVTLEWEIRIIGTPSDGGSL